MRCHAYTFVKTIRIAKRCFRHRTMLVGILETFNNCVLSLIRYLKKNIYDRCRSRKYYKVDCFDASMKNESLKWKIWNFYFTGYVNRALKFPPYSLH